MDRLVITRKTRNAEPVVKYIGSNGDKASKAIDAAGKLKDKPEVIELYTLGRPAKRVDTTPPSKEELEIAKKRDADEAERQAALKKAEKAEAKPSKETKGASS